MPVVDLSFPVLGETLPVDHGYVLYAALCRTVPELRQWPDVGVHSVRGDFVGDDLLQVTKRSALRIRTPVGRIGAFLALSGQPIEVDGRPLRIGIPRVLALRPTASLGARMVTVKGFMEPEGFLEAARRQLDALGISREAVIGIPHVEEGRPDEGKPIRRVMRIKDKTIVGFAVQVSGLTAEESLTLQEHGIGGRRHMGCGVFVPFR